MVRSYIQDTDCSVYIHTKNIYLLINKIFKIRQHLLRPIMIKTIEYSKSANTYYVLLWSRGSKPLMKTVTNWKKVLKEFFFGNISRNLRPFENGIFCRMTVKA